MEATIAGVPKRVGRKKKFTTPGEEPPAPKRIAIQSSPEWIAWLERAARFAKVGDMSKFVEMATASFARTLGFPEEPPDRIL